MGFKNILKKQINSITAAATLVAIFSLTSRFLGMLRDRILAAQFGAGQSLDIYYAAFRIPDLVFNILVLGALSAGFIPVFTNIIKDFSGDRDKDGQIGAANQEAWNLVNNILNFLFLALILSSIVGIILAPYLMHLIAPGFDAAEQAWTVALTRIMFLSPIFLGISGIFGGVLQSFKRFFVYSLAPIFYNLGIIIGVLYFVRFWGLYGLAWGVVLGAIMHMSIQLPMVYHLGFRYRFRLKWRDYNTRQIAKMMVPRTLSLGVSQINLVIITAIASRLSKGSLTIFNFANNLQSFPIGLFGISFAIAAFPVFSLNAFRVDQLIAGFSQTLRKILFFVIPSMVLVVALRAQIIRVVLGAGKFNWQDTTLTMNTLAFFAISMFAQATIPLLNRVFYARNDSATPFYISVVTVIINTVAALFLAPKLGVTGLALALSLAYIIEFILLWVWLSVVLNSSLNIYQILKASVKLVISAIAAGGAAQITKGLVWPFINMSRFSGVFIQLTVAGLVGGMVYLGFCYLLKSEELIGFLTSLKHRLPFKKVNVGDQGEARGI